MSSEEKASSSQEADFSDPWEQPPVPVKICLMQAEGALAVDSLDRAIKEFISRPDIALMIWEAESRSCIELSRQGDDLAVYIEKPAVVPEFVHDLPTAYMDVYSRIWSGDAFPEASLGGGIEQLFDDEEGSRLSFGDYGNDRTRIAIWGPKTLSVRIHAPRLDFGRTTEELLEGRSRLCWKK